jgi:hypothetical protein
LAKHAFPVVHTAKCRWLRWPRSRPQRQLSWRAHMLYIHYKQAALTFTAIQSPTIPFLTSLLSSSLPRVRVRVRVRVSTSVSLGYTLQLDTLFHVEIKH